MKSAKVISGFVLALAVFASNNQSHVAEAKEQTGFLRVGIYCNTSSKNTLEYSSQNKSQTGFEIGYISEGSFKKLFELDNTDIMIAPSGNLFSKNSGSYPLYPGNGGNFVYGGYHLQDNESYQTYKNAFDAAGQKKDAFAAFINGSFFVRYGNYTSKTDAENAGKAFSGSAYASPSSHGITLIDSMSRRILFEYSGSKPFALKARNGGTVTLPLGTAFYSYKGYFEYTVTGNKLMLVNGIDLENYVKGVMSVEIGTSASSEVTKAFSILVRTVAMSKKHSGAGYDVCSQSCCQAYRGTYRQNATNDAIVDSTKGMILTYQGSPIRCFYNYSNGGASCSSAAAWGSTFIPYLTSVYVEEPEDKAVTWQKFFKKDELLSYLKSRNAFSSLKGGIESLKILETDPHGSDYVTTFEVRDIYGNTVTVFNSAEIRGSLGFMSSNFTLKYAFEAEVADSNTKQKEYAFEIITSSGLKEPSSLGEEYEVITADGVSVKAKADIVMFDGKGKGHGVGFSQVGAEALISEGHDFSYTLKFYFPGAEITKIN